MLALAMGVQKIERAMAVGEVRSVKAILKGKENVDDVKRVQFTNNHTELKRVDGAWDIADDCEDYIKAIVEYLYSRCNEDDDIPAKLTIWASLIDE